MTPQEQILAEMAAPIQQTAQGAAFLASVAHPAPVEAMTDILRVTAPPAPTPTEQAITAAMDKATQVPATVISASLAAPVPAPAVVVAVAPHDLLAEFKPAIAPIAAFRLPAPFAAVLGVDDAGAFLWSDWERHHHIGVGA